MASTFDELREALEQATDKDFRKRLLARGQSRAMIWRDGVLPPGTGGYDDEYLSEDLLTFGYSLLLHAIRFIEAGGRDIIEGRTVRDAFEIAAEAIEVVVARGKSSNERGFHRLIAASAFHLGRFSARAFSILNSGLQDANLSRIELCLAKLMLRDLNGLDQDVRSQFFGNEISDEELLKPLQASSREGSTEGDTNEQYLEVLVRAIEENYMKSIAQVLLALERGQYLLVHMAKHKLSEGLDISKEENLVTQWWVHRLTIHLVDGLWETSFHNVLPITGPNVDDPERWKELRQIFISSLYKRDRAEIELWPSQIEAAYRVLDFDSNLVLSLPTSAGKTRIAELCILACLAQRRRVVFVTPLRALSAQTEVSLQNTFSALGAKISSLYGSIGAPASDVDTLRESDIVVATPEKLDFALRASPDLLDNVGLIVLDEGHMIGLSEREIRYEAQVQRLLRRSDAASRRIICLSAILPDGEQLTDFTNWLNSDKPNGLIKKEWRPTRLRYGEVIWKSAGEQAILSVSVGEPNPFVPGFIKAKKPPKARWNSKDFPSNQRQLCIATAWKLMDEGQTVLIFCPERRSVLPFATAIIDLEKKGLISSVLAVDESQLATALAVGTEWFGEDHAILKCLRMGVAVHHGELPTPYRKEIERLLREGILRLTISSPTLAQGLNLAATSLIFFSLTRYMEPISISEFRNVVGRAGRAFVDVEGLVLFPIFKDEWRNKLQWKALVTSTQSREMESGILNLLEYLLTRMKTHIGFLDNTGMLNYVAGQTWDFPALATEAPDIAVKELKIWEGRLASLDTAIFSLLGESDISDADLAPALDTVLEASLLKRRLSRRDGDLSKALLATLHARAKFIWDRTSATQRRAYFLSGVGFKTGTLLDMYAVPLEQHLIAANEAIGQGDHPSAAAAIVSFAEIAFTIHPFIPKELPSNWNVALRNWLLGVPATRLAFDPDDEEEDALDVKTSLIEHAFSYNLCWAMEAVRSRAVAHHDPFSDEPQLANYASAHAVTAVDMGTLNISAMLLMKAGFKSRLGAIAAATSSSADFTSMKGMVAWLKSQVVADQAGNLLWPTPESRNLWQEFLASGVVERRKKWKTDTSYGVVNWYFDPPADKTPLIIGGGKGRERVVYTADLEAIGETTWVPNTDSQSITIATATIHPDTISLVHVGPESSHHVPRQN